MCTLTSKRHFHHLSSQSQKMFFGNRWLRRLVRKHTTPIPLRKATNWHKRLSIAYAIAAWNVLGYLGYMAYKGENMKPLTEMQRAMTPSQRFAVECGIDQAKVIHIKGFTKVSEMDFDAEKYRQPAVVEEPADEFDWNTQDNVKIEEETQ